jgi:magnesium-transporting ATPase (P-type)
MVIAMEDQNNEFSDVSDRPSGKSPNFVPKVLITNTLCFSTILILLFFLSVVVYKLGFLDVLVYKLRFSSIDATDILTYIFELIFILIVTGCILVKNKKAKKYFQDHFGVRKIEVKAYKPLNKKQMH